jgi:hypothetical protein
MPPNPTTQPPHDLTLTLSVSPFHCLCYQFKNKKEKDNNIETVLGVEFRHGKGKLWFFASVSQGFCGGGGCSGFVKRCVKWDSEEGDLALEVEILEFMKDSKNLDTFPSKKELVEAGRMDLVDAIANRGGWLSLGWDLRDEDEEEQENVQENGNISLKSAIETQ